MSSSAAYNRLDRLLHHVALGWSPVALLSFDMERGRFLKKTMPALAPPVFIAGLARAGTTLFARALEASGAFASARYNDMPFPLAPNGWEVLSRGQRKPIEKAERGHGDGMLHDLSSIEAIEEVFWRTHEGDRYIKTNVLVVHHPAQETLVAFGDWMALIRLREARGRYLSKNNNNVVRCEALSKSYPDALFLHPFRDPVQQAGSLLRQHQRALSLHAEDPFRRRYMSWLGHHEFGADHRPFVFDQQAGPRGKMNSIDYWLELWISTYEHLLKGARHAPHARCFIDYDYCCAHPGFFESRSARLLGVTLPPVPLESQTPHGEGTTDTALLARATTVHAALIAASRSAA
jgi:hypothetical protein